LAGLHVPAGGKKMPKIYDICVHPLRPAHVLASTNAGVALLCLDVLFPPPAAALPLLSPTQVSSKSTLARGGADMQHWTAWQYQVITVQAYIRTHARISIWELCFEPMLQSSE
jgi:hypothetical protein